MLCQLDQLLSGHEGIIATYDVSPASSSRILSFLTFSTPSRNESSDLEMCPSCDVGSRLSDIARCRSSKDNFIWSARRKYWLGFAMMWATCRKYEVGSC